MTYELPSGRGAGRHGSRPRLILLGAVVVVLFLISRWLVDWVIDYLWWNEMGQFTTWVRLLEIRYLPFVGAWLAIGIVMWIAHAAGLRYAEVRLRDYPLYSWIATAALVF